MLKEFFKYDVHVFFAIAPIFSKGENDWRHQRVSGNQETEQSISHCCFFFRADCSTSDCKCINRCPVVPELEVVTIGHLKFSLRMVASQTQSLFKKVVIVSISFIGIDLPVSLKVSSVYKSVTLVSFFLEGR